MFGDAILRLLRWFGGWNVLIAAEAVFWGGFLGAMWRVSPWRERSLQQRAAREQRFCHDCRWALADPKSFDTAGWRYARCLHPSSRIHPEQFLVTGEDHPEDMNYCSNARIASDQCGPLGRFWEPGLQLIAPPPAPGIPAAH